MNAYREFSKSHRKPDHSLANLFNEKVAKGNKKFRLRTDTWKCHFTGDIHTKGKIVTVSLNPAWGRDTRKEHRAKTFEDWYEHCRNRFTEYDDDKRIHLVFKNLLKVIAPGKEWQEKSKRDYLQDNLINLDWCPYYSTSFPTFRLGDLDLKLRKEIKADWDRTLMRMISLTKPRYVFVHGKSMGYWVDDHGTRGKVVATVLNSRGKKCRLWRGRLQNGVRLFYLEHFINIVNSNKALAAIGRKLPGR